MRHIVASILDRYPPQRWNALGPGNRGTARPGRAFAALCRCPQAGHDAGEFSATSREEIPSLLPFAGALLASVHMCRLCLPFRHQALSQFGRSIWLASRAMPRARRAQPRTALDPWRSCRAHLPLNMSAPQIRKPLPGCTFHRVSQNKTQNMSALAPESNSHPPTANRANISPGSHRPIQLPPRYGHPPCPISAAPYPKMKLVRNKATSASS
jgi:hypothetical protein